MALTETEVRTRLIRPAIQKAGWSDFQIGEEKSFTAGRIIVRGKTVSRGERKRADFILYYKANIPLAIVEAKDDSHRVGDGIAQAREYGEILNVPFVYSSNGSGFIEYNFLTGEEREISIESFPSPEELHTRYIQGKNYSGEQEKIVSEDYFPDAKGYEPRYYQTIAVNRVMEAIAEGKNRMMLVMATGTGKTYTAFQIIYRLWSSRTKKRILFLVDRTALAQQTMQGPFRYFGDKMTWIKNHHADPAYEIYIALYQGITGNEDDRNIYKQFSREFFDLVIVDECHRGVANENSAWREVLEYFSSATQIGLTATPKDTAEANNFEYFGDPVYTYSLKQGIDDGFLAPYRVVRYILDKDIEWRPDDTIRDTDGNAIEDKVYNVSDYNKKLVVEDRINLVAERIVSYLRDTDPMQKTIIFCTDIDHAERMRAALTRLSPEQMAKNHRYIMRMTGDNDEGKKELENFINPESPYPTIVTTSELLTTGVDAQTCKLIVLDAAMNSMTKFKQIIGRGTRINKDFHKYYFTIMDFSGATRLFADPSFDGDPVLASAHALDEVEYSPVAEIESQTIRPEDVIVSNPQEEILLPLGEQEEKKSKRIIADGVTFNVIDRIVQIIDPATGKLVTESLTRYATDTLASTYLSLDSFLEEWNNDIKKEEIIKTLEQKGVVFDELRKELGDEDLDEFDIILHLAFGKKPLTRSQRAGKVSVENLYSKYEGVSREVISALIEKYATQGITAIDDVGDLQVAPFSEMGTVPELVSAFGGKERYLECLKEIQLELYK